MKKTIIFIGLLIFGSQFSRAQQHAMLTQYMFNGLYLNPAYAGTHDYWTSTLTYRNQWAGVDGAPETAVAAVDGPIANKNMGLGVIFYHDRIGITRENSFMFNYAYQLKLNEKLKLSFGASAGFSQFSAKLTDLTVWDDDQVFDNDISSQVQPRFGIGTYLYAKKYYLGFSIPTLFAAQKNVDFNADINKSSYLRRHYLLTAGYVFDISDNFKLRPSVLGKYVQNAPFQADINLFGCFKEQFWIGTSYRTGDAIALLFEYQSKGKFRCGYSYDITTSKLRDFSNGSHEFMVGFDFGRAMAKVKTPRYF